jgi:hypothetical protein
VPATEINSKLGFLEHFELSLGSPAVQVALLGVLGEVFQGFVEARCLGHLFVIHQQILAEGLRFTVSEVVE